MNIIATVFSEQFEQEFLSEFFRESGDHKFLKNDVIQNADSERIITIDDLQIGLFLSWRIKDEQAVLVIAEWKNDCWNIVAGFKILASLIKDYPFDAIYALNHLVSKFGTPIIIGDIECRLFIDEKFRFIDFNVLIPDADTELMSIKASDTGLCLTYTRQIQDGNFLNFHVALAFSIDTYAYSKWLYKWEDIEPQFEKWLPNKDDLNPKEPLYTLSDSEIDEIYSLIRESIPDDISEQKQVAALRGAYILLKKVFGDDFYKNHLIPDASNNFLNRDWSDSTDNVSNMSLITYLASAIFTLQNVPNFYDSLEKAKNNTQHGDNLETLWFEVYVPYLIKTQGHKVLNFIPEVPSEKTPDLLVDFRSQLILIEIKAKLDGQEFNGRNDLSKPIRKACKQLPQSGPGVVFLLIPSEWKTNAEFVEKANGIIQDALLDNRNCNAVFIFWFESVQLDDGRFVTLFKFRPFANRHPLYVVPKIVELVSISSLTSETIQFAEAIYLQKAEL